MQSRALGTAQELLSRLPHDPAYYPQKLDLIRNAILIVGTDEACYRRESFLDDRMIQPGTRGTWLPISQVVECATRVEASAPSHLIFHIGHCGSTLVSRVLAELDQVLPLREPLPLRLLADEEVKREHPHWLLGQPRFDQLFELFQSLWSRRFSSNQRVVIKATSGCNDLAGRLLVGESGQKASGIALYLSAEDYVATMLKEEESLRDLYGFAEMRLHRLHRHLGDMAWTLQAMSAGEMAAMSWATEILALQRASDSGAMLWLRFDDFLTRPEASLRAIAEHFGWSLGQKDFARMVASSAFGSYAKAPEHAYDSKTRSARLDESRVRNRGEIDAARRWLDRAVLQCPDLAEAPAWT